MATTKRKPRRDPEQAGSSTISIGEIPPDPPPGTPAGSPPTTTGRYLILLDPDAMQSGMRALSNRTGVRTAFANASDFNDSAVSAEALTGDDTIVFNKLGVAVVSVQPDQLQALSATAADEDAILAIEEERVVYAISDLAEYLRGYQDAVNHLAERLNAEVEAAADAQLAAGAPFVDTDVTWGLQATNTVASKYTGKGIRVAVLDTGFDLSHPDFVGRRVVSQSFVLGQTVNDGHGHGTHCIGTAMGPKRPGQLPRYGVAYEADIYAGKVLSNQGSGSDAGILAGIEWAINMKCAVISMSLGAATSVGQTFSRVFEAVARRALAAGTLIVAAAGNESRRPGLISPVSHPANCPSILSVAALDSALNVAPFSCGGLSLQGGQVDIAGPGVNVRSSWPRPTLYRSISGTSMATPHVAGLAALHAEANPDVRGGALGWLLLQSAQRLNLTARDCGAGLAQAA